MFRADPSIGIDENKDIAAGGFCSRITRCCDLSASIEIRALRIVHRLLRSRRSIHRSPAQSRIRSQCRQSGSREGCRQLSFFVIGRDNEEKWINNCELSLG